MNEYLKGLFQRPEILDEIKSPVPFAFSQNGAAFQQWSARSEFFQISQQQKINLLEKSLKSAELTAANKLRLEMQLSAEVAHLSEIKLLLSEFNFSQPTMKSQDADNYHVPNQQHIDSYKKNIFRDWAWGSRENESYVEALRDLKVDSGLALIVGGGSGRLLYDLCLLKPNLKVVQIDINPVLSLVGKKMCAGEKLTLTEISSIYLERNLIAQTRTLSAPSALPSSQYDFVLGDVCDNSLNDHVFDVVICPWLIDVVGEPFNVFSRRLNSLLKPNGELLIFGPLSFEKQPPLYRYSAEEIEECLDSTGFAQITRRLQTVPYLQSPQDVQSRQENILVCRAVKSKNAKKAPTRKLYPEWMIDITQKGPAQSPQLLVLQSQKNIESQFLSGLISGRSIEDLAQMVVKSGSGLNIDQARSFVMSVFVRLFENGEIGTGD